jgi:hypothetical protein
MVGPLVTSVKGNSYILTIYDPFSHWPGAYAVPDQKAETVIKCLKQHVMLHSVPAEVLSDRGKNFMSAAVKDFLDQLGAKKYETAPYKPSTNGSVERFHAYLASAMSHYVENEQETWDEFLDGVLFAYRTTPIDGLDISPFEVIYGRNPNLPIDNMLFRENYEQPINTLEEYMDALHEYQLNMCEVLQKARRERFERNKRNHGAHKGIPMYEIGDKVYLSFPKGHFRPLGKSTKLSPINDGPYTVLGEAYGWTRLSGATRPFWVHPQLVGPTHDPGHKEHRPRRSSGLAERSESVRPEASRSGQRCSRTWSAGADRGG